METFGKRTSDVDMAPTLKNQDLYCVDDGSDDDMKPIQDENENEPKVFNPSKAKFNKYLEEIRLRELKQTGQPVSGTFGDGGNTFNFVSLHKVDPACSFENMEVMQDYSCVLTLEDVNYN